MSKDELYNWLRLIVPDFDEERVYQSDIKKLVQWYNSLHAAGLIDKPNVKKEEDGNNDN